MNPLLNRTTIAWLGALLLLATPVTAKKSKDNPLDRMKPVPADQPIPTIDFFRPYLFIAPELNPTGTHFAALVSTGADRQDLAVLELASMKIERVTGGGDLDIAKYEWLSDKRVLFSLTKDKLYSQGLYTAEVGNLGRAYAIQVFNVVVPVGFPRDNPQHLIIWIQHSAYNNGDESGVLKIDTRRISTKPGYSIDLGGDAGIRADIIRRYPSVPGGAPIAYMAGADGELAFAFTRDGGFTQLHRMENDAWQPCPANLDLIQIIARGECADELLVLEPRQEDKPRAVRRFNARTGALGEIVFKDEQYDFVDVNLYRHPVDDRILGVRYDRKGPDTLWIDATYQGIQDSLQSQFPKQVVRILGSDRTEKQFFIMTSSDVAPPTYHHLDIEKGKLQHIANVAPWIDPARMRPMKLLTYKARDGRPIDAYLTLPAGASKESPAPLVVLPHGGPWVRDKWRWDSEVQFLASRGFAVFQPNYRGSDGTTWRFPQEDLWAFRKMHDDVTDGVKAIVRTGYIDPDRVAIMGGSFGGYLALCGAAFEPDLYRCAITIAGIFDWERVLKETKQNLYRKNFYGVMKRHLGDPKTEHDTFEAISPLRAVEKVRIPVFVAHGTEDVAASIDQTKRLIAAFKEHGVAYESQIEREEGHGFHKLENQVELYDRLAAFLEKHLAARTATAAAKP